MVQTDAGWEEYYDYIFPDDESAQPNLKLLAMAKMWKKQTEETHNDVEDDADDGLLFFMFISSKFITVLKPVSV